MASRRSWVRIPSAPPTYFPLFNPIAKTSRGTKGALSHNGERVSHSIGPKETYVKPALLPFRRILRSTRALGICLARRARAGKDLSVRIDPGCRASFHHFQRGNLAGTVSLLRSALRRLDVYPEAFAGVAVDPLRATIRLWLDALETPTRSPLPPVPQLQIASTGSLSSNPVSGY